MKCFLRSALLLGCGLLWAASAPLYGQGATGQPDILPDGPGKSLITTQCVSCHAIDVALTKRGTSGEWRTTIQAMVERGAPITNPDAAVIAGYLAQFFGPNAAPPTTAPSRPASALVLTDGPGRDVLTRRCFQCHQASMWNTLRQNRQAWDAVLYRMVGRGALWSEDDIRAMGEYLASVAGPAPQPSR